MYSFAADLRAMAAAAAAADPAKLRRLEKRQEQLEQRMQSMEVALMELKAILLPSPPASSAKAAVHPQSPQPHQEEEVCQMSDHSSFEEAPLLPHSPASAASSGKGMQIPYYRGELDGDMLWNWLDRVEEYFKHGQACEDEKVLIATYHLKDAAYHWWKKMIQQQQDEAQQRTMDWPQFKNALLKRFMPASFLQDAKFALMDLQQQASVSEYNCEFAKLVSRLPGLHHEDTLAFYVHGLKHSVRSAIDHHSPQSLQQAMRIAELCCDSSSCW